MKDVVEHVIRIVHGDRSILVSSALQKRLEYFLELRCRSREQVWIAKVTLGLSRSHKQRPCNHFSADRFVLHLLQRNLIEIRVRVSVVTEFQSSVNPSL